MTPRDMVRVVREGDHFGRVGVVVGRWNHRYLVLLEGERGSLPFRVADLACIRRAEHPRCALCKSVYVRVVEHVEGDRWRLACGHVEALSSQRRGWTICGTCHPDLRERQNANGDRHYTRKPLAKPLAKAGT